MLVGGSLAMAGATYQGVFRNPLADPYLLGVSAGAGFGATFWRSDSDSIWVGARSGPSPLPRSSVRIVAVAASAR